MFTKATRDRKQNYIASLQGSDIFVPLNCCLDFLNYMIFTTAQRTIFSRPKSSYALLVSLNLIFLVFQELKILVHASIIIWERAFLLIALHMSRLFLSVNKMSYIHESVNRMSYIHHSCSTCPEKKSYHNSFPSVSHTSAHCINVNDFSNASTAIFHYSSYFLVQHLP